MENKPLHYDGSMQHVAAVETEVTNEGLEITDDMRKYITGNPYVSNREE